MVAGAGAPRLLPRRRESSASAACAGRGRRTSQSQGFESGTWSLTPRFPAHRIICPRLLISKCLHCRKNTLSSMRCGLRPYHHKARTAGNYRVVFRDFFILLHPLIFRAPIPQKRHGEKVYEKRESFFSLSVSFSSNQVSRGRVFSIVFFFFLSPLRSTLACFSCEISLSCLLLSFTVGDCSGAFSHRRKLGAEEGKLGAVAI